MRALPRSRSATSKSTWAAAPMLTSTTLLKSVFPPERRLSKTKQKFYRLRRLEGNAAERKGKLGTGGYISHHQNHRQQQHAHKQVQNPHFRKFFPFSIRKTTKSPNRNETVIIISCRTAFVVASLVSIIMPIPSSMHMLFNRRRLHCSYIRWVQDKTRMSRSCVTMYMAG